METLLTILGMAIVTLFIRFIPIVLLRREPAPLISRWLRFVPVAVFTALVVPGLLVNKGEIKLGPELWVGMAGALVAFKTRQVLLAILVGLATYWLLRGMGM